MLQIPDKSLLPGTGPNGDGISPVMKTQQDWIDTIKNSCQSCHALGSQGVRRIPKAWDISTIPFRPGRSGYRRVKHRRTC